MENTITAWYANNAIYQVELNLSLSFPDWCKMLEIKDFLHLIQYLCSQGILKIDRELLQDLNLKETQEF